MPQPTSNTLCVGTAQPVSRCSCAANFLVPASLYSHLCNLGIHGVQIQTRRNSKSLLAIIRRRLRRVHCGMDCGRRFVRITWRRLDWNLSVFVARRCAPRATIPEPYWKIPVSVQVPCVRPARDRWFLFCPNRTLCPSLHLCSSTKHIRYVHFEISDRQACGRMDPFLFTDGQSHSWGPHYSRRVCARGRKTRFTVPVE